MIASVLIPGVNANDLIGAIISILLGAFLIYALLKPEGRSQRDK